MRLSEALDQTPTATLRRVASAHGLAHDDSSTRDELIALLCDRLTDGAYLEALIGSLTAEEREVLTAAHASSGELRGLLIDSEHPGIAEDLVDRGWLFRVFAAHGPLRGEVYAVPEELLARLPNPPPADQTLSTAPSPEAPRWTDPAFSLFALASAKTRSGASLEKEVRPWSQEPGNWPWEARWTFLEHLATVTGLLAPRAQSLPRMLDDRPALADRLWRAYLRDVGWSDLAHTPLAHTPDADPRDLVDTVALRRALVTAIDELPAGEWVAVAALSRWLQRSHPTLVREQLTPRGLVLFQILRWDDLELPLLRYVLLGPLYWLGQIASDAEGKIVSRRSPRPQTSVEACHWEGSSELVAPASAELGALVQAERYLVLRERGRISRYQLLQSHVAAALGAGGSLAECRQLLGRLTQTALPATVEERLSAWDQRFGALDLRPAVLLEARSAEDLDTAIREEGVRPFVRRRLGDNVAEVAAAGALELAAALRSADHLPRVDAALRLAADAGAAFGGLVDEQVLEFLLVSLLAFQRAWPERLAELEGSAALLERLEQQFPAARLTELRLDAERLAGSLRTAPKPPSRRRSRRLLRKKPR